jgi:hypothetical protein
MTQVETIATAEPSTGDVKPMVRHIIERAVCPITGTVLGEFKDKALCGALWDRLLPNTPGPICESCKEEFMRRPPR